MIKFKYAIIILLCFTIGCNKKGKTIETPPKDFNITYIEDKNIEVYSNFLISDLVIDTNGILLNANKIIDTTKLGNYKYKIEYEYLGKKYTEEIDITIVDTTPPLVLGGTTKTVLINHNNDLCDLILYADNYDQKANCQIIGNYDLSKEGTYKITYNITDSSNNKETLTINLKVVSKKSSNSTATTKKIYFKDILAEHKNENTEIGIDVSKWQENIDFNEVKAAGATFVIMRIGVQKTIKGELEIDSYYYQNIKNAKAVGLKVGVYLYSKATSIDEAIEHANWVLEKLDGTDLDLPIVFDWESWSIWNSLNLSLHDINSIADTFLNVVESKGYKGMLYGSKYYLQHIWTNNSNYPVWLAHYTTKTDYNNDYYIWQLGDTGKIDGISGYVDINILYKEKEN